MQRNCDVCQKSYEAKRPSSKFCSPACKQRAFRAPEGVLAPVAPIIQPDPEPGSITEATLLELQQADRVSTSLGQAALLLARRLDGSAMDTGSSIAALVREHRVTLTTALDGAHVADDPLDELKRQREQRRA